MDEEKDDDDDDGNTHCINNALVPSIIIHLVKVQEEVYSKEPAALHSRAYILQQQ